jgi:threonine aldolase
VFFRPDLAKQIAPLWHRSGQRLSKTRFLSAQLDAYLTDDLWLRNAGRANEAAARIAQNVSVPVLRPVQANVVFLRLEPHIVAVLRAQDILFHDWELFGPGAVRIVTGFDTTEADVDAFVAAVNKAAR